MVKAHLLLKILSLEVITFVSSQTLLAEIQSHVSWPVLSNSSIPRKKEHKLWWTVYFFCVNTDCLFPFRVLLPRALQPCLTLIILKYTMSLGIYCCLLLMAILYSSLKNIAEKSFCVENCYGTLILGLTTSSCILYFFVAIGSWKILIDAVMYIIISKMSISLLSGTWKNMSIKNEAWLI